MQVLPRDAGEHVAVLFALVVVWIVRCASPSEIIVKAEIAVVAGTAIRAGSARCNLLDEQSNFPPHTVQKLGLVSALQGGPGRDQRSAEMKCSGSGNGNVKSRFCCGFPDRALQQIQVLQYPLARQLFNVAFSGQEKAILYQH